ncbi:MAG TPA: hypothetical protein VEC56_08935, partial [Candidatus Krumholzibacteria bacterium]|nr:hypothetical protein [Candidatus Krumholzibacteria bacterium]
GEEPRAEKVHESRSSAPPAPSRASGLFDAASGPDTLPQRTSSIFEEKTSEGAPTEALPGLGEILDRLSQGQRDVLQSNAGVPASSDPVATPARPAASTPGSSIGDAPESEWNMDQFRRDLQNIASTLRQSEPRDG